MKILSNSYFKPVIAASALALTACTLPTDRLNSYMEKAGRTQVEYNNIRNTIGYDYAKCQRKLDSMAYRDLLEGTELAQDSSAVAAFNELSSAMVASKNPEKTLTERGFAIKDIKQLPSGFFCHKFMWKADYIAYKKFFTDFGLGENKEFMDKFEKTSEAIKP